MRIAPLIGVEANDPCTLPAYWKDACLIWIGTIQRLCANFDYSDAPWEYLERTNSAIFASALSASGAPSMPETYVMRDGITEQADQRVDICTVNSGKSIELIEFKMAEYDVACTPTSPKIDLKMEEATAQVNNITGIHGREISTLDWSIKRAVGVLGLPFFYKIGSQKTDRESTIQALIHDLQRSAYDVKAWVFPHEYIEKPSGRYKNQYYAGTYLVAKHA